MEKCLVCGYLTCYVDLVYTAAFIFSLFFFLSNLIFLFLAEFSIRSAIRTSSCLLFYRSLPTCMRLTLPPSLDLFRYLYICCFHF